MEASKPIRDGDEWEKGDKRVKPWNRRQPGRPRLPWTAARTTKCYGSIRPALCSNHRTTQLLSQLLCRTVTKTMSVALPLGNNWSKVSPTLKSGSTSLLLTSSGLLHESPAHLPPLDLFWASSWESSSPPSSWSPVSFNSNLSGVLLASFGCHMAGATWNCGYSLT